mmetsp:Transcript_25267/g.47777  ORF Transcript_25267/g.47777 Transcript_25267/m.47777 type:complete len:580 (+) Transcript_25267:93-1832(+)|eukprot:CAMPEP_0114252640 /NCGR_PEP_ID=MMETSP0058-20121206/15946_1 /TAXON_ID=36894 /ORGANISM="Pyramimonas parkeae, CCMP726" /LENGTH=579 /DNA_ID=CAMNT_0001366591 /DNA_START=87 /DNA_END=1826 /DNA_ORIENTATION=+
MSLAGMSSNDVMARDSFRSPSPLSKPIAQSKYNIRSFPSTTSLAFSGSASMEDLSSILISDRVPVLTKSKVCCTVGSKSRSVAELVELLNAGMSIARFDFSWGDQEYHSETLRNLEAAMKQTGKLCATMLDTRGPELLIERKDAFAQEFQEYDLGAPDPIILKEDDMITITTDMSMPCNNMYLPIDNKRLPALCKPGDIIFVGQYLFTGSDTTSVYMEVESVTETEIVCVCNNAAELCGKLLIMQIVGKEDLSMNTLTEGDIKNIVEWGVPNKVTFISLSYCKDGKCVQELKSLLAEHKSDTQVAAKVERVTALRNFDSILEHADAVILSRACLGLDVPVEKMALIQKMVLQKCNLAGKPVIITRVMDSMTSNPRPTRAEATDVANIVLDGADGILLGAETLRGDHAALSVRTVLSICKEAEKVFPYDEHFRKVMDVTEAGGTMTQAEALASSAVRAAMKVEASMLVVFTESGTTARQLSKYRPRMPILSVIIPRLRTNGLRWVLEGDHEARRCAIHRGVFPVLAEPSAAAGDASKLVEGPVLDLALSYGRQLGLCTPGSAVVVCQRLGHSATVKVLVV